MKILKFFLCSYSPFTLQVAVLTFSLGDENSDSKRLRLAQGHVARHQYQASVPEGPMPSTFLPTQDLEVKSQND